MCAIIGALGRKLPSQEQFIKARDTMTHRGPDDAGVYYKLEEGIVLGHRRLSIIDLSSEGRQPLFSHDGRYAIVFNGEIYNYKELKQELKNHYPFKTQTDTEVLLAAYSTWGARSLQKLNGMFAFAIWDKNKRELFCARDRLGIKPLYWSIHNGNFYFSSEIKGILESSHVPRILNKQSALDYLSYRYPLGENTFFENVHSFLPGHYVVIKNGVAPQLVQYWKLPVVTNKKDLGEEVVIKTVTALLKDAVRSHMISDVPLGAYLSGGLDSSVLAGLMTEISNKPVKTFSVGFSENGFNELEHARHVAEALKTDHHEILMKEDEYFDLLPKVIAYKDSPLHVPNEIPLYALSKELKKHITVVLSGEGADELFGGYGRIFRSGYDFERMNEAYLKNFSDEEKCKLKKNLIKKYGNKIYHSTADHLLAQYPYTKAIDTAGVLNEEIFSTKHDDILNIRYIQKSLDEAKNLSPAEQYMHFFERVHLLGILGRLDNASMGASVEGRVPFIDHTLAEYVSALPLAYKMRWKSDSVERLSRILNSDQISDAHDITKYLLRTIGKNFLPKNIVERKKMGFPVPLDVWLNNSLRAKAEESLLSGDAKTRDLFKKATVQKWLQNKSADNGGVGRNIWALLNIEMWMRKYGITA